MSDSSALQSKINSNNRQLTSYKNQVSTIDKQLEILQRAKQDIINIRQCIDDLIIHSKNFKNINEKWSGTKYDGYAEQAEDYVVKDYKNYLEGVKSVLNAVRDKITALENQKYEVEGLIGKVKKLINSLKNELEKLLG